MHVWRRLLHHTHAICGEFQISPHLSRGNIWKFSTCGEIFNFPTIVIHEKLKFLHMTICSPLIILVILVTNMRSGQGKFVQKLEITSLVLPKFIPDLRRPVDSFDWKFPNLLQLLSDSLITWKTKVKSENVFNSWRMIGSRWQIYVFAKILLIPNFWKSWQSVNFKFVKTLKFVYFLFPEKLRIY